MSHSFDEVDEVYEVYSERTRKARKAHKCDACDETIPPGTKYFTVFTVYDGGTQSLRRCARCQAIHEHLRELAPGEMWPAEALDCGEEYKDHWGVEPPPEIARLAFLLPGEAP